MIDCTSVSLTVQDLICMAVHKHNRLVAPRASTTFSLMLLTDASNSENRTATVFRVTGLPSTTSAIKTFLSININKTLKPIYNAQYTLFQN